MDIITMEHYFCLKLTSNEHDYVEYELRRALSVVYYRELKDGHIPMFREIKVLCTLGELMQFIRLHRLEPDIVRNPYAA